MDGEAGWWIASGNISFPPLARVMGVGRQQQGKKQMTLFESSWPAGFHTKISKVVTVMSVMKKTPQGRRHEGV